MLYQVVAKSLNPPGDWVFYPHWEPTSDEEDAFRLVSECVSVGFEAAVLRAFTLGQLERMGYKLVVRHDTAVLPSRRYVAADGYGRGPTPLDEDEEDDLSEADDDDESAMGDWIAVPEPSAKTQERYTRLGGSNGRTARQATNLDAARWRIEQGPGSDIDADGKLWRRHPHFPEMMPVLSAWMRLAEQVQVGDLGGAGDGERPHLAPPVAHPSTSQQSAPRRGS